MYTSGKQSQFVRTAPMMAPSDVRLVFFAKPNLAGVVVFPRLLLF
jgi:hypothetical protein